MSEQEEKPGLVDRLKNVFFEPAPPKEAPPDEVVSAEAEVGAAVADAIRNQSKIAA